MNKTSTEIKLNKKSYERIKKKIDSSKKWNIKDTVGTPKRKRTVIKTKLRGARINLLYIP